MTEPTNQKSEIDEAERLHLEDLLQAYQSRLRPLEKREAISGLNTPPEVLYEIDQLRSKITKVKAQLGRETGVQAIVREPATGGQQQTLDRSDSTQPHLGIPQRPTVRRSSLVIIGTGVVVLMVIAVMVYRWGIQLTNSPTSTSPTVNVPTTLVDTTLSTPPPSATKQTSLMPTTTSTSQLSQSATAPLIVAPTSLNTNQTITPTLGRDSSSDAVIAIARLNMREGPGVEYKILSSYTNGSTLKVIGRTDDMSWLKVEAVDGGIGWMSASSLRVNIPLENVAIGQSPPKPTHAPFTPKPAQEVARDGIPDGTWSASNADKSVNLNIHIRSNRIFFMLLYWKGIGRDDFPCAAYINTIDIPIIDNSFSFNEERDFQVGDPPKTGVSISGHFTSASNFVGTVSAKVDSANQLCSSIDTSWRVYKTYPLP
jgi:hypothetical protein